MAGVEGLEYGLFEIQGNDELVAVVHNESVFEGDVFDVFLEWLQVGGVWGGFREQIFESGVLR